jgi:uncharacterized repeat protein (TIGR01451 family)
MIFDPKQLHRASLALVALGSIGLASEAFAVGTPATTPIDNRATVNYTVGGVAQTPIESSPTGNSTAGVNAGANTSFVVDNRVDLTVTEESGGPTNVSPGQNNVVASFIVRNTGNAPQGYQLTATNLATGNTIGLPGFTAADAIDMNNLRVFIDVNDDGNFVAGDDTQTVIDTLNADTNRRVFIVADTPLAALNAQAANVRLTAITTAPGTNAAAALTETTGADTAAVDVVFGDGNANGNTARDGQGFAADQYLVQSAALTVAKTSSIFNDPFNGGTNPKAIPGAVIEYAIVVSNSSATTATGVVVTDPIPANTAFVASGANAYNGGASNVQINVGSGAPTFCVAEAGSDSNADGCFLNGSVVTVGNPAVATVGTGAPNAVTVRFRVTIN